VKFIATPVPDLCIVEPRVFSDDRGFFFESWNAGIFREAGLDINFVQDNHSRSAKGVLRGLHFQNPNPQGKLVRVTAGRAWDVAIDLRRSSPTCGRWHSVELSAANKRMFWVPPGFAHGFVSLEEGTDVIYKCTAIYESANEQSLLWNDPTIGINWPLDGLELRLSAKDMIGVPFDQIELFA